MESSYGEFNQLLIKRGSRDVKKGLKAHGFRPLILPQRNRMNDYADAACSFLHRSPHPDSVNLTRLHVGHITIAAQQAAAAFGACTLIIALRTLLGRGGLGHPFGT